MPADIISNMQKAERNARSSKVKRLIQSPVKYALLLGFNKVVYPQWKKGILLKTKTFFNQHFRTRLPAGTDIALNGIKAHDSEIRLTKYLVQHLQENDSFIDVGAHYGYYTLLASTLTGDYGKVYALEPSADSFKLLTENCANKSNIHLLRNAAADQNGEITFYEYPGPYAEYNTTVKNAYSDSSWIHQIKETVNHVQTIVLDDLIQSRQIKNPFIKIDAEGGELAVLKGLRQSMTNNNLTIILEYLVAEEASSLHQQAVNLLKEHQYQTHIILSNGNLQPVTDINLQLRKNNILSDNLVFKRLCSRYTSGS